MALIGADGSGKTTFGRRCCAVAEVRARYVYMGSNPSAATHMLPTTRVWTWLKGLLGREIHHSGPPDHERARARPSSRLARSCEHLKSLVLVGLRASEDMYRFAVAAIARRRGFLVILDRHPYPDYRKHLVGTSGWRRWGDRLHAYLVQHVYPMPDLVILLDAPAPVLHARKLEGSLPALEARAREYRELAGLLPNLVVVDVDRPDGEVFEDILRLASGMTDVDTPRAQADGHERRAQAQLRSP